MGTDRAPRTEVMLLLRPPYATYVTETASHYEQLQVSMSNTVTTNFLYAVLSHLIFSKDSYSSSVFMSPVASVVVFALMRCLGASLSCDYHEKVPRSTWNCNRTWDSFNYDQLNAQYRRLDTVYRVASR